MAIVFNGITAVSKASAILNAYPVSFACWFNASSIAAIGCVMSINNGTGGYGIGITVDTSGHAQATAWAVGGNVTTTSTLATGAWHHLAATFSSATVRAIYMDGANKVTGSTSEAWGSPNSTDIGRGYSNGLKQATGTVAFAGIWNVALSDADVTALGNGAHPLLVQPQALVACLNFTPGSSSNLPDLVSTVWNRAGSPTDAANPRIYA